MISVLTWILIVLASPPVHAWGKLGHEVVGNLAWALLSNATANVVRDILQAAPLDDTCEQCTVLGQVADWADQVRHTKSYAWSGPLHYIDVHDDQIAGGCPTQSSIHTKNASCHFDYRRDCGAHNVCVAGAIVNYTAALTNDVLSMHGLMFLTHFIGDIHQPLHVARAADKGGNTIAVHFDGDDDDDTTPYLRRHNRRNLNRYHRSPAPLITSGGRHGANLHALWDTTLLEHCVATEFRQSRVAYEHYLWQYLQTVRSHNATIWSHWMHCANGGSVACTTRWAEESLQYALTFAYRDEHGHDIASGDHVSLSYYQARMPMIHDRLVLAAVRLAATLEVALLLSPASASLKSAAARQ